eukprot:6187907-Pleurochrysis_carterae.AAC.1
MPLAVATQVVQLAHEPRACAHSVSRLLHATVNAESLVTPHAQLLANTRIRAAGTNGMDTQKSSSNMHLHVRTSPTIRKGGDRG